MDISYEQKLSFDFLTTQKIIKKIGEIDSFSGKWELVEQKNNRYLKELRRIATIESIGSSTRIEGAVLTNDEIKKLISNVKITDFKTRDEQEVYGYYETLDIILENATNIELTENYIKQLHSLLLKYSEKDQRHRGVYKNLSNQVVANYPDGTKRVIFDTTPPHLTGNEMFELINWVNENLENKTIHPLIIVGTFIYEFLSIHPFQDGNGRLSRLLTTYLLLKTGYDFAQYVSFEGIIEQKKAEYYSCLMSIQQHRNTPQEIISGWIFFFLDCLGTLTNKLQQKYEVYQEKGNYKNERQKSILKLIEANEPLKLGDIHHAMPNESINTIKKDLQYLLAQNEIKAIGVGKGTVYAAAK